MRFNDETSVRFSPSTWREIYEVRARLEAYRDKVQPYPAEEEPRAGHNVPPEPAWTGSQWQLVPIRRQSESVQQLRAEVEGWRQKHAEALLAIDRFTALLTKKRGQY